MQDLLNGLVIGLHMVSVHVPTVDGQSNINPGIYARTEAGLTAGVYRNTLRRTSIYGGFTFTTDVIKAAPLSLTVGGVTGYKEKREPIACQGNEQTFASCYEVTGYSKRDVTLLLSPSVELPWRVAGAATRLSYIPGIGSQRASVFHLSIEKRWD